MGILGRLRDAALVLVGQGASRPAGGGPAFATADAAPAQASVDWGGMLGAARLVNLLRGTSSLSDPRAANTWVPKEPYSDPQREALGRNGLARRCVSIRIADALRPGWAHHFPDLEKGKAKEAASQLRAYERKLKARAKLKRAATWAEEHGHAIVVIGVDDQQKDLSKPVALDRIKSVRWLKAIPAPRYQVGDLSDGTGELPPGDPLWFDVEDLHEPEVEVYRTNSGQTQPRPVRVHWTRVLGPFSTEDGHSRFDEYGEALEDFFTTHDAAERFASTLSIGNHKVSGWNTRTAQDEEAARGRIRVAHEGLAATNNLITDKEEEEFTYVSRPATGVGDILDRKQVMLGGFTGIPGMKLFGLDPAGFSSGREVLDSYYGDVTVVWEDQLAPEVLRLDDLIMRAADGPAATRGEVPEHEVHLLPLRVPSATELSAIRTQTWTAGASLVEKNVADRREVRESLFGAGASELSPTIQLAPADAAEDEQAPLEVGVAQALAAVLQAGAALGTPDQRRAMIKSIAPQVPEELVLRMVPDAPEVDPSAPAEEPVDVTAPPGDRWITVAEVVEQFGSVTAGRLKARRAPRPGRGQPGERDDRGRLVLHWIAGPLYLLGEVRTSFEEGGADLDPATPDTPTPDAPAVTGRDPETV